MRQGLKRGKSCLYIPGQDPGLRQVCTPFSCLSVHPHDAARLSLWKKPGSKVCNRCRLQGTQGSWQEEARQLDDAKAVSWKPLLFFIYNLSAHSG